VTVMNGTKTAALSCAGINRYNPQGPTKQFERLVSFVT
jgi:hypothetical protein